MAKIAVKKIGGQSSGDAVLEYLITSDLPCTEGSRDGIFRWRHPALLIDF
jgi:hypothetical protein